MKLNLVPFNIDLLIPKEGQFKDMSVIKVLDIFEGSTKNFHPEGLFSTQIFGKLGEDSRYNKFAYINLKVPVFHPVIYKTLGNLKRLYKEIIEGKAYAVWDSNLKDFERSTPLDGETGFHFFLRHFKDIHFEERDSVKRTFNLKLIEKYRDNALLNEWVILPPGFRDFEISDDGKYAEDEINKMYRSLLSSSFIVDDNAVKNSPELINSTRINIQNSVSEIYEYVMNMLEGKKKFILGSWASRKIFNGTMNVITAPINNIDQLHSPLTFKYNETMTGLFQYLKSILPVATYQIKNEILSKVFVGPNEPSYMTNSKTLKKELVNIEPEIYDDWMSSEGLERTLNRFAEHELRHEVLSYDNYYFGMIYRGPDQTVRFVQDVDELPEGRSKDDLYPMTIAELFYLSVFKDSLKYSALLTRYPIAGLGSIYPSKIHLYTTTKDFSLYMLDDQWNKTDIFVPHFPDRESNFFNSMSPHPSHNARLGADYDGDRMSFNVVYSEEANQEIDKLLNSREYYVGVDGSMLYSSETDTVKYIFQAMTG